MPRKRWSSFRIGQSATVLTLAGSGATCPRNPRKETAEEWKLHFSVCSWWGAKEPSRQAEHVSPPSRKKWECHQYKRRRTGSTCRGGNRSPIAGTLHIKGVSNQRPANSHCISPSPVVQAGRGCIAEDERVAPRKQVNTTVIGSVGWKREGSLLAKDLPDREHSWAHPRSQWGSWTTKLIWVISHCHSSLP